MYERRRARVLLSVLTLIVLGLVTVDARTGDDSPLHRVRQGASTIFGPLQEAMSAVVRPFTLVTGEVSELLNLREENARLREELERQRERRRVVADVTRENESLRDLLEMQRDLTATSDEFETVTAQVVALAPSNFEWTVTLDVGDEHGVRRDMVVISGDGIVGRVVQAGPRVSRVLLAVDRSFSAAVRLARTGEHGYIEGGGTDPLRLQLLDPEADVRVGDEVVTSSYSNALFPDGLPVGRVDEVGEETGLLVRDVEVRPFVDFTQLTHVLVILRAPPVDPLPLPSPGSAGRSRPDREPGGVQDSWHRQVPAEPEATPGATP